MNTLSAVINEIDTINQQDPRKTHYQGNEIAQEYLYSLRMTAMLHNYDPEAGPLLQIAARGQHIRRWAISRKDYPTGRNGYLKWRKRLKIMHGELLAQIMQQHNFANSEIEHVKTLVTKQQLKTDEDSKKLEDVVCLVFLQFYFEDFIREHPEAKLIDILRKTWGKMTRKGQAMALELNLSEETKKLVKLASA